MADWPYNTSRWLLLRREHLELEPWCRTCRQEGRARVANTVDHVVPISAGGDPFPSHDGLASYCVPCHSRKTVRGSEAGAVRTLKPRRGCNSDGSPLDPAHPWHPGKSLGAKPIGPHLNLENQLDKRRGK